YAEMARVLRPEGRALVYRTFGTERLASAEAEGLWTTVGGVPTSAVREGADAAVAAAGPPGPRPLRVGGGGGGGAQEETGRAGGRLLHASRLLRDPERYVERFVRWAYEIMLGDCLWHVYGMIGKLEHRVDVLSKPGAEAAG